MYGATTDIKHTKVPSMLKKISKEDLPTSDMLLAKDVSTENTSNDKPRIFMSKKTQKMYVRFPNGDHYEGSYTCTTYLLFIIFTFNVFLLLFHS